MNPDEFVPGSLTSLWAWIEAVGFEDVENCRAADVANAQFAKFSEDASNTPTGLAGETQDDVLDLGLRRRSAAFGRLATFCLAAHPAAEGSVGNDAFKCGWADGLAKSNQPPTFRRRDRMILGNLDRRILFSSSR